MTDQYTTIFLPFENNIIYNECVNNWKIYGNTEIRNTEHIENGRFKTTLYLDESSYLYCDNNIPIVNFNIDFTIDFWYYINIRILY